MQINKKKYIKIFFLIICTLQIFYLFNSRSNFKYEIIKNPFSLNSGVKYAVSAEIIESRKLLLKNNIIEFNLSKNLLKDIYFYQRSIEFNYPIRFNKNSASIFYKKNEIFSKSCKILEGGEYLNLVSC